MPSSLSTAAIRILRPLPGRRTHACEHHADGTGSADGKTIPTTASSTTTVPELNPTDPITLSNEFDRENSIADLEDKLHKAGYSDVEIVPVSLDTVVSVADQLAREMEEKRARNLDLVVFQLCDGTELDGYPGVSMIEALEQRKIAFTGSDSAFYVLSSSKPALKKELQAAKVPTSSFQEFDHPPVMSDLDHIIGDIGFPMIVKPSISYASINISMKSVVHTPEELLEQVHKSLTVSMPEGTPPKVETQIRPSEEYQHPLKAKVVKDHNKGIDIETPTVFVEKFLAGREFTVLVVGDKNWGVRVFPVAERAFDPRLGKFERLLSFDQYWAGYSLDGDEVPANEDFCKYQIANEAWQEKLQHVAKEAYLALEGTGYGRVDIRTVEMDICEPVVLEVNANCGLSFEKDTSSLANILIMSHVAAPGFVKDLVEHALHRNKRINGAPAPTHHVIFNTVKGDYTTTMNSGRDQEILVQG
ncbi:hypothetical protein BGZ59_001778 [Podila verticillata]|nr:hypothetical protein BGZ59_001778 [Podila verticillata]KFH68688.1 hypothetical protein MVEG_05496 [Podila verticillata NRRL 6337]